MRHILTVAFIAISISAVHADGPLADASVEQCGGQARVDTVVEPWSDATRTFANGKIRIALLDTAEPACCSAHLAILAPDPNDELGLRQCKTLSDGGEFMGFQAIDIARIKSSYNAAKDLLLSVPVERYIDGIQSNKAVIGVRINQATGAVTIE